jgi:PBP1b-binding outer membrane lipoprotein LpoB
MKVPNFVTNYGEWATNEIYANVIDSNWIQISYEQYRTNAYTYKINVSLNIIDKLFRKITLEEKTKMILDKLKNRLDTENKKIRHLKETMK